MKKTRKKAPKKKKFNIKRFTKSCDAQRKKPFTTDHKNRGKVHQHNWGSSHELGIKDRHRQGICDIVSWNRKIIGK